ncbi:uncharacterized protein F4822DRAFT_399540 [Hypoxylon trugodes]|uniref:uncharacterized protein n=1 Tax=Hypoxylon trugodes TaxID=326681 RepID=UPI0021A0D86D|nr:uncharacterized protein F4822DRAFT_399540 [Hypoxylon trugodes]KAI1389745.1 hypothetical protein F4822DRAFT_399540 [Hypoxylon trugodes]
MASSSSATPESLITLKVNFDGVTRRFKLPLKDLVISTLEDKLRAFLQIPFGTSAMFERYSDSAASFVVLDQSNVPAYKQLYRAAKAKQKLKLRITTRTRPEPKPEYKPEPEENKVPKPVTVEDEVEAQSKEVFEPTARVPSPVAIPSPPLPISEPVPASVHSEDSVGVIDTIPVSDIHSNLPDFIKLWRTHGMPRIHLRRDGEGNEVVDLVGSPSSNEMPASINSDAPESAVSQIVDQLHDTIKTRTVLERSIAEAQTFKDEIATVLKEKKEADMAEALAVPSCPKRPFTVCCNSCDRAVPDAHFHCSICDDGDFDLCQECVNQGITCYGDGHWLIKRTIKDGEINYSTTYVNPKPPRPQAAKEAVKEVPAPTVSLPIRPAEGSNWATTWAHSHNDRTCNSCVQDLPGENFLHCTTCDDYDLCKSCFAKDKHGHHPGHGFTPAVKGTTFDTSVSLRLSPGRNASHNAICDGCDKYVRGIRHKCLDCPDWDYCSECVQNANFIHPGHRFVPIHEPLTDRPPHPASRITHYGICCDGPLCVGTRAGSKYIVGIRYKCAVCHDKDFCANCEASPSNTHNKTHPLIKFKTPVRHVSVTTTGEHEDGQRLPTMGDRVPQVYQTRSTSTAVSTHESIAATPVQTVVDVQPTEQQPSEPEKKEDEVKTETSVDAEVATLVEKQPEPEQEPEPKAANLVAIFLRDTVADGTVLPPNHTFEQEWVLRNEGSTAWPAGCSVKFVGGDYMGAVDPTHPAGIHELVSASESTVCYNALKPGQEFAFTVLMRTPDREGKVISYWRLTTPEGDKFGHKLWCDVNVQAPAPKAVAADVPAPNMTESQMIIPKLEHESPSSSMHEIAQSEAEVETEVAETDSLTQSAHEEEEDDFEDCGEDEEWAESDSGFMTDEEYDILDASDEEYLSEQRKSVSKK